MNPVLKPEREWSDSERRRLQSRLESYYETVPDYSAFHVHSAQTHCWEPVAQEIRSRLNSISDPAIRLRLLEVGAARSGLGDWLAEERLRDRIHWTAQDVTNQNREWLDARADEVFIGDVAGIAAAASFDIIVSTYVLEHTPSPAAHLGHLHALLAPKGSLFLFCPRYDMPGYLCPSSRHLRGIDRASLAIQSLYARFQSLRSGRPAFLIQTDLAAFHGPFFTDADAVHWVSLIDLRLWATKLGLHFREIKIGNPRFPSKDWIVKRLLTCAVQIGRGDMRAQEP